MRYAVAFAVNEVRTEWGSRRRRRARKRRLRYAKLGARLRRRLPSPVYGMLQSAYHHLLRRGSPRAPVQDELG